MEEGGRAAGQSTEPKAQRLATLWWWDNSQDAQVDIIVGDPGEMWRWKWVLSGKGSGGIQKQNRDESPNNEGFNQEPKA